MQLNDNLKDIDTFFDRLEIKLQLHYLEIERLLQNKTADQVFLSPATLKAKYDISYTTLQRWKRNGVIDVYRIPGTGKIYINEGELLKLLWGGRI